MKMAAGAACVCLAFTRGRVSAAEEYEALGVTWGFPLRRSQRSVGSATCLPWEGSAGPAIEGSDLAAELQVKLEFGDGRFPEVKAASQSFTLG